MGVFLGGTTGNTIGGAGLAANTIAGNVQADMASQPIPLSRSDTGRPQARATGPAITEIAQQVNGAELSSLTVKFNEPIKQSRAEDIRNYRLRLPGKGENFNASDAIAVPVRSASYDASSTSVTLTLATPLRSRGPVQLRVSGQPGRGIANLAGSLLNGVGGGQNQVQAGTDYVTILRLTS